MSIQNSAKWLAMAGIGVLVSGCVSSPAVYSPGNVSANDVQFSNAAPGNFVADPSYGGGGYYEVVEVYEDPFYDPDPFYTPAYYGGYGTSLVVHSHGGYSHRHDGGHKSHEKHPAKKRSKRDRGAERSEKNKKYNRRNLTPEQIVARNERQAACRAEGFENCREKREADARTKRNDAQAARRDARKELRAERRELQRQADAAAAALRDGRPIRPASRRSQTRGDK